MSDILLEDEYMILRKWSGRIKIGAIEADVSAVFINRGWSGNGTTSSLEDSFYLNDEFTKRTFFDTQIGTFFINRINPIERNFSFEGTGEPLF